MKRTTHKFTLVELLVVIGIASLLMGLVIPAFSRMVTGSAVDRLASNLKVRLQRAQSEAASSRRHVALILPNGTTSEWTSAEEQSARLGGSRMCYVEKDEETGNWKFDSWVPDCEWITPERGALLVRADKEYTPDAAGDWKDDKLTIQNSGDGINAVIAAQTSGDDKPLKDITGDWSRNNCAIIFSPYGSVKTASEYIYLAVAECSIGSSGIQVPPNAESNFRVLRIRRLSGIVEYAR